jgi:hypothetical protein
MNNDDEDSGDKRELKGYGHPPKEHRWKKGKSGNPAGRPRKPKKKAPDNSVGGILQRVYSEEVEVNGVSYTRLEIELRQLANKAAKGDMQAIRQLDKMRNEAGLMQGKPPEKERGGVLVVPSTLSQEEWALHAEEAQRRYRENQDLGVDELSQILAEEDRIRKERAAKKALG